MVPIWQQELARAITDPRDLFDTLQLDPALLPSTLAANPLFRLRVPRSYVARMRKRDPSDPLLRQIMPVAEELVEDPGFAVDPVGELDAMPVAGLMHKYVGRALLVTTGAGAVHCRFCFRRHFPYAQANPAHDRWRAALDYVASNPSITEIVLSGGDPLALSDERLEELSKKLEAISHLRILRIHSRLPIVLPERVDDRLLGWLAANRLSKVVVVHANHANEIDQAVAKALARLKPVCAAILNQSVLLRGVNDTLQALKDLSEATFRAGALPYYLHLLDPVEGAGHFDIDETTARELVTALSERMPGYLIPRLVKEKQGHPFKIPLL